MVEKYFNIVDADNSGTLNSNELTGLLDYYDEMANRDQPGRIVLPGNHD